MREAVFESDTPFLKNAKAAALLSRTQFGNLHAGVLYVDDAGNPAVLHLGWEDYLSNEWPWIRLWVAPDAEPELLAQVGAKCRNIWELYKTERRFPYGLNFRDTTFDAAGRLKLGAGAKGLTCATFIFAVFGSVGVPLVLEDTWPVREAEDRAFLKFVSSFAAPTHLKILTREVDEGCKRIQPHEAIGACACAMPGAPASFDPAAKAGAAALEKLDARIRIESEGCAL